MTNDSFDPGSGLIPPDADSGSGATTHLFEEFPPTSADEWKAAATRELKDGDFDKRLIWNDENGLRIQPMSFRDDLAGVPHCDSLPAEVPYHRGYHLPKGPRSVGIAQEMDVDDPASANADLRQAIAAGQNVISFVVRNDATIDRGRGVALRSVDDVRTLLNGLPLHSLPVTFRAGLESSTVLGWCIDVAREQGLEPTSMKGGCDFDPISHLVLNGSLDEGSFATAAGLAIRTATDAPGFRPLGISAEPFAFAGATTAQELALVCAAGCEMLRRLTDAGVPVDTAARSIRCTLPIGVGFFAEIAKLRAVRMLWSGIVQHFGATEQEAMELNIHTRTSRWSQTVFDPNVNILRSTVETIAATIGGSPMQTVHPFDDLNPVNASLSKRLARNTQIVLHEESLLTQVIDPVAGSYHVETLTQELARAAWTLFQSIEAAGGLIAALTSGMVHDMLAESLTRKRTNIATRREILIGTNQYPNLTEHSPTPVTRPAIATAFDPSASIVLERGPLAQHRAAEEIEDLRLTVEAADHKPRVLLATFGSVFWRRARAAFSSGFLGVAGFDVVDSNGFDTMDEAADAAMEQEADIVVACAEDELYPTHVPELVQKLRAGRPGTIVVVAGYPKESVEALQAAGVDAFIHVKANLVTTHRALLERLGIERRAM